METLYQVLGISPDSEDIVVRAAYDALMQKYNPDTFRGARKMAEEKTKAIYAAYEVLRRPEARAEYDRTLGINRRNNVTSNRPARKKYVAATTSLNGMSGLSNEPEKPANNKNIAVLGVLAIAAIVAVYLISNSSEIKDLFKTQQSVATSASPKLGVSEKPVIPVSPESTEAVLQVPAKIDWNAKDTGDPKRYSAGPMHFALSTTKDDKQTTLPTLDADLSGLPHLHFVEQAGFDTAAARVQVLQLKTNDRFPSLIFITYSGGAHCCTQVDIFAPSINRWVHASTGGDGEPLNDLPVDVNGDGIVDIALKDDRFDYTFDSYAGSNSLPMFFNLVNADLVDVSANAGFASRYKQAMVENQADCILHLNGGCAAFVASAARLGLYDWAWQFAIANYDRNSGWIYPKKCDVNTSGLPCPADHQVPSTFPEALDQFLSESGYDGPQAHARAAEAIPGFDCAHVTSSVLQLICATPDLAASDRTLTAAYFAVGHLNGAPLDLKSDQIDWIRLRNNSSADVSTVQRLYDQRIAYLTGLALSLARAPNTTK